MSVQSEITRLENAKAAIKAAIEGKGVTVPEATLLDGMASLIESIEAGGGVQYATGTFTPAQTTALNMPYKIEHNLGYVPDAFFWWSVIYGASCNLIGIVMRYKYILPDSSSVRFGSYVAGKSASNVYEGDIINYQPTTNAIWIRSGSSHHKVGAGQTYNWIAFRGLE